VNFWKHTVKLSGLKKRIITHLSLCPPFTKGGSGGISEAVENPPKSPFKKGDFKASTLKDES
jgi:hypothetical protein